MAQEPHQLLIGGQYFARSEVVCFSLIGIAIGGWLTTFVTLAFCYFLNRFKLPQLSYRLIPQSKRPMEVVVEQEPQLTASATPHSTPASAPNETPTPLTTSLIATEKDPASVKQSKNLSNKSLAKTQSDNTPTPRQDGT